MTDGPPIGGTGTALDRVVPPVPQQPDQRWRRGMALVALAMIWSLAMAGIDWRAAAVADTAIGAVLLIYICSRHIDGRTAVQFVRALGEAVRGAFRRD